MKRVYVLPGVFVLSLFVLAACGAGQALPVATSQGEIRSVVVPAPSLLANRIGESDEQPALVYLPPSYATAPDRRYPVLYLLHGIGGSPQVWTQVWNLPAILDRLHKRRELEDVVIVMPNGRNRFMGGFYKDSPVTGNWGQFIAADLVRYIDSSFRTIPRREARAIAGHSMGGYGAVLAGMTHPEQFSVVHAISPCCLEAVEDLGHGNAAWQTVLGMRTPADVDARVAAGDFYPVALYGLLSVMLPNPGNSLLVDFPVQQLRRQVLPGPRFHEWVSSFPIQQIQAHREALLSLTSLTLEYGVMEQFAHIPAASASFSRKLSSLGIPHTLHVHDGDHRNRLSERLEKVILPAIGVSLEQSRQR